MYEDRFHVGKYESLMIELMIDECSNFEEFEQNFSEEFLREDHRAGRYLDYLLDKYGWSAVKASNDAKQSPSYIGHVINGRREPSRDAILCICLTIGANVGETQNLLKFAGKAPLYVRKKRDVIVWFGLMKHEPLDDVDKNVRNRGFTPLYKEKNR